MRTFTITSRGVGGNQTNWSEKLYTSRHKMEGEQKPFLGFILAKLTFVNSHHREKGNLTERNARS